MMSMFEKQLPVFLLGMFVSASILFGAQLIWGDSTSDQTETMRLSTLDATFSQLKNEDLPRLQKLTDPEEYRQALLEWQQKVHLLVLSQLGLGVTQIPGPMQLMEEATGEALLLSEESATEPDGELATNQEMDPIAIPPLPVINESAKEFIKKSDTKKNKLYQPDGLELRTPKSYLKKSLPLFRKSKLLSSMMGKWNGDIQLVNGSEWRMEMALDLKLQGKLYVGSSSATIYDSGAGVVVKHRSKGANQALQQHQKDLKQITLTLSKDYFVHLRLAANKKSLEGILYRYNKNHKEYDRYGDIQLYQ